MVTAAKGMLIRKPPAEVFRAFVDPAVTTKFWFTHSTGPVVAGATLTWTWQMFGASVPVVVTTVEDGRRIVYDWGAPDAPRTVEMKFVPYQDHTYVHVSETGFTGSPDAIALACADSASGFALVLAAAKALLEYGLVLPVVADHVVPGLAL